MDEESPELVCLVLRISRISFSSSSPVLLGFVVGEGVRDDLPRAAAARFLASAM